MKQPTGWIAGCLGIVLLIGVAPAAAQDGPPDINFEHKVDQAIKKGISYLKGKNLDNPGGHQKSGDELILLTYVHAGVPQTDAHFQELLKPCLEGKLVSTYRTALIAMILEELDRVAYQERIRQCAQFLVNNMSKNGTIRYGKEVDLGPTGTPSIARRNVASSGGVVNFGSEAGSAGAHGNKPEVKRRILVKQMTTGPDEHDMSNMQYLALGLRACHDAGIDFERGLIKRYQLFWRSMQIPDKDAQPGLLELDPPRPSRAGRRSTQATLRITATPAGWGYQSNKRNYPYGSMSVGGVGALCIASYILKENWKRDPFVLNGLQWIATHFSLKDNPKGDGAHQKWQYYYLYGLERAGMLFGTERIGKHRWYREGAEYLLKEQAGSGAWNGEGKNAKGGAAVRDTCFAILFLKRATRRLPVASVAR